MKAWFRGRLPVAALILAAALTACGLPPWLDPATGAQEPSPAPSPSAAASTHALTSARQPRATHISPATGRQQPSPAPAPSSAPSADRAVTARTDAAARGELLLAGAGQPPLTDIGKPKLTSPVAAKGTLLGDAPAANASAKPAPAPAATGTPVPATMVPILMYHYIRELPANTPDKLGYGLSVAPALFDQQLAYLSKAGYTSVSMDQVSRHITHGAPLPRKPIVLSFDDGYADFYSAAWPLLQKYHFGATIYLVVDFLGRPGYMSWQQAHELQESGVEIGAHTLDHIDLAIQTPDKARRQIDDSRSMLQQRLGVPVTTFAYPSGRFNATTVELVAQAGFSSAVTTAFGEKHTPTDLLTMTRVRVPGGISLADFVKNLG